MRNGGTVQWDSNQKLKDFINSVTEFTDADIEDDTPLNSTTTPAQ